MFGRKDSEKTQATPESAVEAVTASGKGRPTPKRREAEQANRRPVVSGGRVPAKAAATKEERKAAREARRVAMQSDRAQMRQAMLTGDERFYPERDKGPARKWARDYVDARRNIGEYFLFFAIAFLLLSQLRNNALNLGLAVLLYAGFLAMAVDAYLIRRKVLAEVTKRFGADKTVGLGMYAISRALQIRRMRLPRPQVARGEYPE